MSGGGRSHLGHLVEFPLPNFLLIGGGFVDEVKIFIRAYGTDQMIYMNQMGFVFEVVFTWVYLVCLEM